MALGDFRLGTGRFKGDRPRSRSSLHANGGPVLGRRHKCNNLLFTHCKWYKLKHWLLPQRRVAHGNVFPVVPSLPPRKFLNPCDQCVWFPAHCFRTQLPFSCSFCPSIGWKVRNVARQLPMMTQRSLSPRCVVSAFQSCKISCHGFDQQTPDGGPTIESSEFNIVMWRSCCWILQCPAARQGQSESRLPKYKSTLPKYKIISSKWKSIFRSIKTYLQNTETVAEKGARKNKNLQKLTWNTKSGRKKMSFQIAKL